MPLGVANHEVSLFIHITAVVLSPEYRRRVRLEAALETFADLLVIAAVYLMVTKLGL